MKTIYLFLDFDGVLQVFFPSDDYTDEENDYFAFAKNVEKVIVEYEDKLDIKIVLSTSWRYSHTLDRLKAYLPKGLADKVIGVTPMEDDKKPRYTFPREDECRQFMVENNFTGPWLALDDCPDMFYTMENVFYCPNHFREPEADRLRKSLDKFI
jgi:hypothetical protein